MKNKIFSSIAISSLFFSSLVYGQNDANYPDITKENYDYYEEFNRFIFQNNEGHWVDLESVINIAFNLARYHVKNEEYEKAYDNIRPLEEYYGKMDSNSKAHFNYAIGSLAHRFGDDLNHMRFSEFAYLLEGRNVKFKHNFAYALCENDSLLDVADMLAEEIVTDLPDFIEAQSLAGRVKFELGDYEAAKKLLTYSILKKLDEAPKETLMRGNSLGEDYHFLGKTYEKLGDEREAENNLRLAKEHGYKNE